MTATPRVRACPGCGNIFDSKRRWRTCNACRERKRLADLEWRKTVYKQQLEGTHTVEPRDATSSRAAQDYAGMMEQVVQGHEDGHLCFVCLKPTPWFYMVAGSDDFYRRTLKSFGIPPMEVVIIAGRFKDPSQLRRTPVCATCAPPGLEKPNNYYDLKLLEKENPGQRVPVKILAETDEIAKSAIAKVTAQDDAREAARMPQKDMQLLVDSIVAKGYFAEFNGGHFKIFAYKGGPYVTTVSSSPTNPTRTKQNVLSAVRRWERDHPKPQEEEAAEEVPESERTWTLPEMAAIIARYDDLEGAEQRQLLAKQHVRRDDIPKFRKDLKDAGWKVPDEPVPLPDEQNRTQMCTSCAKDKPLTRDYWDQYKADAKFHWADQCLVCLNPDEEEDQHSNVVQPIKVTNGVIDSGHARAEAMKRVASAPRDIVTGQPARRANFPVPVVNKPPVSESMSEDEAAKMVRLVGRKREIKNRLGVIDDEKARLVRKLDEEKVQLEAELRKVETELLEAVSG